MNRREFVNLLVLREICDDYENVDALARLVQDDLAKAYVLSSTEPFATELHGMPAIDLEEVYFKTYFYVTKKGKDLYRADDAWWPFDDENNLRKEWRLEVAEP